MTLPSPQARRRARIEIIPLIDVVFFLLATFVMVSLSMVRSHGIPVNLPAASSSAADDRRDELTLSITEGGEVWWDREPVTREALPARLAALRAERPDARVFLNGDARAHLGDLVGVLDLVREAGISAVAIETRPAP
jgi:biopolymer transport protein ExbD